MARPHAKFTETDLKRAVRVAQASGDDWAVRVNPDGSIELYRRPAGENAKLAPKKVWVT